MSHQVKPTTIINLYGGPGTGKSTSAAFMYYLLKNAGKNVELVREYVKDWAWDERRISTYDQIYFLGKQTRRESMLYGKVDYIVTDSPVMMGVFYANKYCPPILARGICDATKAFYGQAVEDGHRHEHVFLTRIKPYVAAGRYQSEEEARKMDEELRNMLAIFSIPTTTSTTAEECLRLRLESIIGEKL